jgi:hypothetical protein
MGDDGPGRRAQPGSELGRSRRDVTRRGAVVGGTLLWAAPVVQSIAKPASARSSPGTARFFRCYCHRPVVQAGRVLCTCAEQRTPVVPNSDAHCAALGRSRGYRDHDVDPGNRACSCGTGPCTPCSCN